MQELRKGAVMKKIILIVTLLVSCAGLCYAQMDQDCFDKCMSESSYKTDGDSTYCTKLCSGNQIPYPQQQIEMQKQQLEIQKESLELQKQQLEIQKESLEMQKQLQPQAKQNTQEPVASNTKVK